MGAGVRAVSGDADTVNQVNFDISRKPSGEAQGLWSPRRTVACVVVAALILGTLGFRGMWPWLVAQCRRAGPVAVVEFWLGDAFAVLWFLWAAGSVFALGGARLPVQDALSRRRIVVVSLALGIVLRLAFTIFEWRAAQVAYRTGEVTTASVVAITPGDAPYILHVQFTDRGGTQVSSEIRLFDYKDERVPAALGVGSREQLWGKPTPFPIQVRYDRGRPQRCWVEGAGTAHSNDLLVLSLLVILFEAILLPLIWEFSRPGHPAYPLMTDYQLYRLAPLAVEAFILCCFGLLVGGLRL